MKKVLTTPIKTEDLLDLRIGDVLYLDGTLVTARDSGHKRRVLEMVIPSTPLEGGAVFHAGPITKEVDGKLQIVAIGPTTSMRMERYEADFITQTGVKIIIGKGGEMLKKISSMARTDCEKFMGTRVYLTTWVKYKENWRDNDFMVRNFGYRE